MEYYRKMLRLLEEYFSFPGWEKLFLTGGCYWLACTLQKGIRVSRIMVNRMEEHCALYFENGLYDVTGKISVKNFRNAEERDLRFMEKNYVPHFDVKSLEQYLKRLAVSEFSNGSFPGF